MRQQGQWVRDRSKLLLVLGLALVLACVVLLLQVPIAFADNCDLTLNPRDCQNTAWVIGGIASVSAGAAGLAAAFTHLGGTTDQFTPVDNALVRHYIDDALKASKGDPKKAFEDLSHRRESNCYDMSMAAADHYLFARYLVGGTLFPATVVAAFVVGYDLLKTSGIRGKTGNCPPVPADMSVVGWGLDGVMDGQSDFLTLDGS
jgi:hypothetical protein